MTTPALNNSSEFRDSLYLKARKFKFENKFRKSIRSFNEALKENPEDAILYIERGLVLIELGRNEEAFEDFNKSISIDPNSAAAYNNRGFTYSKLDKFDKALQDFTKAIEINPAFIDAYRNRADLYDLLEKPQLAIQDYTKVIELKPNNPITYNDRGESYDSLERYHEAIQDYTKAIQLKPNFSVAYYNRAETYRHLGDFESAIGDYLSAITHDHDDADSMKYLAVCYQQQGRLEEAITYYSASIDLGELSGDTFVNRGLAYIDVRKFELAASDIDTALKLKSCNLSEAYYGKALILINAGEEQQALKELEKSIETDHIFIPAHFYRGLVLLSMKKYKESLDAFKEITYQLLGNRRVSTNKPQLQSLLIDEFFWSSHMFLSYVYRQLNMLQEAAQELHEMWKVPNSFFLKKSNNVDTSKTTLTEILFGPGMTEVKSYYEACRHLIIANNLYDQGEYKNSLKELDKSIELDGKNPEPYALKAMVFNAMGHYKLSIEFCNKALKIEPKLATAYCHKAHATLGQGDNRGALREVQRALELDPNLGFSYYVQGLINIDLKQFKEAAADYDMFLKCMDAHHFPTLMDIARSCINEIANTISADKLVLAEEIGKGDYGTIYKATMNGQIVAAKKFNDTKASAQILHEVTLVKSLPPHTNLVRFIGLSLEPLIAVMDLCDLGNLQKYLQKNKLEDKVKLKIINDIAEGMLHLHTQSRPILHRNLNSTNVLLKTEKDNQITGLISDFGITKSKDKNDSTYQYMAPEVMLEKSFTTKSDAFSFGVVVWEILTQKLPWEGYGEAKMMVAIDNGEQLPLPSDISESMKQLLLVCWDRNPENRWNFMQIVEHLKKI